MWMKYPLLSVELGESPRSVHGVAAWIHHGHKSLQQLPQRLNAAPGHDLLDRLCVSRLGQVTPIDIFVFKIVTMLVRFIYRGQSCLIVVLIQLQSFIQCFPSLASSRQSSRWFTRWFKWNLKWRAPNARNYSLPLELQTAYGRKRFRNRPDSMRKIYRGWITRGR